MRRIREDIIRALGRRWGFDVVRSGFYSPIPDLAAIPRHVWEEPAEMPGVDLAVDAAMARLEGDLRPYLEEFRPPSGPPGTPGGYHFANPFYGTLDAEVLWAMVRHHRPARVLEFGSGWSTLVIAEAIERNGVPARHVVVDPHPSDLLERLGDRVTVRRRSATDVPAAELAELQAGDVLFIDTSHTLRIGGDVVHLLLEGLPRVRPGVVVHIHDVFRPYEYPRALVEGYGVFWQEHWLVQAFLIGNERFEVLAPNFALLRAHADRLRALVPAVRDGIYPSALWLRCVG